MGWGAMDARNRASGRFWGTWRLGAGAIRGRVGRHPAGWLAGLL